jgi:hypothetical protein
VELTEARFPVREISKPERDRDRVEGGISEREVHSVGLDIRYRQSGPAVLFLSDRKHWTAEIGSHHFGRPCLLKFDGQVAGAARDVEDNRVRVRERFAKGPGDEPAPAFVDVGGKKMIQEIVTPGDSREHLADRTRVLELAGCTLFGHRSIDSEPERTPRR